MDTDPYTDTEAIYRAVVGEGLAPPDENETEINGHSQYIIHDNVVGRGLAPAVRYCNFAECFSTTLVGRDVSTRRKIR